jgi:hypothetical protein
MFLVRCRHVQTFGMTSRLELGLMIAKAYPTPVCELGHPLSSADCYPRWLDYVEYVGSDEYVT